ncbi:unnamed protein product [Gadus morhua 'NCC']
MKTTDRRTVTRRAFTFVPVCRGTMGPSNLPAPSHGWHVVEVVVEVGGGGGGDASDSKCRSVTAVSYGFTRCPTPLTFCPLRRGFSDTQRSCSVRRVHRRLVQTSVLISAPFARSGLIRIMNLLILRHLSPG